jgi:hypothetical protein
MKFSSKEFKALQKEWDKKLADSGFQDAEHPGGDDKWLKVSSANIISHKRAKGDTAEDRAAYLLHKQEYYRIAGHFLYDYNFTSEIDKLVWELHSDGKTERAIVKVLRDNKLKVGKFLVWQVLKRLKAEMISLYGLHK